MNRILRSTDIGAARRARQRGFLLNPFWFAGGGGGADIVIESFVAGTAVTNNANPSVTFTAAAGQSAIFGVFFFDGGGVRTLTSADIPGDNDPVVDAGSYEDNGAIGCHLQMMTVDAFSGSGSKTCTVTLSGNSNETCVVVWVLSGTHATPAGAEGQASSAFATPVRAVVNMSAAGSGIFGINASNMTELNAPSGWQAHTVTMANCQARAISRVSGLGAAGNKNVDWDIGGGNSGSAWGITAKEMKKA